MRAKPLARRGISGLALLALWAWASPAPAAAADRASIEATLQRYVSAVKAMDARTVASLFTSDGELLEPEMAPLRGPDAIRRFLGSFGPDVHVEDAAMTATSLQVWGKDALQWGTYRQTVAAGGKPASEYTGRFVAQWARQRDGRWLLRRLLVQPAP